MIPKNFRLDAETLKKMLKTGKNVYSEHFFVKINPSSLEKSRFSIIISKKTSKSSVKRHLIKRQISNILEKKQFKTNKIADYIIFSKDNVNGLDYKTIKKEVEDIIFN